MHNGISNAICNMRSLRRELKYMLIHILQCICMLYTLPTILYTYCLLLIAYYTRYIFIDIKANNLSSISHGYESTLLRTQMMFTNIHIINTYIYININTKYEENNK